jgi:protein-disulfide isomerase
MTKLGKVLLASLVAVSALACQRQDEQTQRKLDYLIGKVESLEKKVAAGGPVGRQAGAPGQQQQPQRPRGPDPAAVYAVDITGAAFEGPANAKVTIVEAFDFA